MVDAMDRSMQFKDVPTGQSEHLKPAAAVLQDAIDHQAKMDGLK